MHTIKMSRIVLAGAIAVVTVTGAFVIQSGYNRAKAAPHISFGAAEAGAFVLRWDYNNDQNYDYQVLATFFKSGEFTMEGLILPIGVTGQALPVAVSTFHGRWRYNQNTNKISVEAFGGDPGGGTAYHKLTFSFLVSNDPATPAVGTSTIKGYGALADESVDYTVNSTVSVVDLSLY